MAKIIHTSITLTDRDIDQLKNKGDLLVDEGKGIWITIYYISKLPHF